MLVMAASRPRGAARVAEISDRMPVRCFLVGVPNAAVVTLLVMALGEKKAHWPLLGVLVLAALVALWGMIGKASVLGRRVASLFRRDVSYSWGFLIGWPIIVLATLVYVLGWVLFAYYAVAGLGAGVISILTAFGRKSKAPDRPVEGGEADVGPIVYQSTE